jgi:membrane-bound metal-dependent hydrolase YbcI (DUF457 family)
MIKVKYKSYTMLGINHAQLAITTTLTASLYFEKPFYLPLLILVVFAGVIPDIDHPNSELGKYFKPLARILPHRGVTHSILGSALVIFLLHMTLKYNTAFSTIMVGGGLVGWNLSKKIFEQHILSIDEKSKNLISSKQTKIVFDLFSFIVNILLLIVFILIWKQELREEIYLLVSLGYLSHLIGDFVTIEGIPLLWPIKQKFGLKLFRTGGLIESCISFCLFCTNIYLIYIYGQTFDIWNTAYWLKFVV